MFTFKGYQIDEASAVVTFRYELSRQGEHWVFAEKIVFDKALADFSRPPAAVFRSALDALSLILGISYWKLFCPKELKLPHINLSTEQAKFWNTVYTKGLGEFFYKNQIDFRGLVNFPSTGGKVASPTALAKTHKSLILWGGGKDSIVTAELFKKGGRDFDLFSLNDHKIRRETAKIAGKKLVIVKREIDPLLLRLNKRPDVYNGHVPVSVVYSATALAAALLYGYDSLVTSCERSADYGNLEYLGEKINHQWSKSEEFEKMFSRYIRSYITPSVDYFSFLRQYDELKIVEFFSKHPLYFGAFSSCNKNFTIEESPKRLWCGECPKCAFVFALLAAYLPKERLLKIFGKNLFKDRSLLSVYRELWGLEAGKPFDCVGTPEETLTVFKLAHERGEYKSDIIMKEYENIRT